MNEGNLRITKQNLAVSSMARNPNGYRDASHFAIDLSKNPIRNVVRIQLSQAYIPRAQSNIVRDRAIKWAWLMEE